MKGTVTFIPSEHKIEYFEFEVPDPEPGALVTEVTQSNVCGSEVHMWRGEFGRRGIMPGHEMSGRILKLGKGVSQDWAGVPVKEGDRIAPVYFVACNRCKNCAVGNFAACTRKYTGKRHPSEPPHFTATFATHYYVRPDQHFYKIPDNVPDSIAASANCAMSQVFYSLDKGRLNYGESVVVQGAGGLGLHAMAIAKARGAYVVAIDGFEGRLNAARQFGADEVVDMRQYTDVKARQARVRELCGGGGPDVVLEVAGVLQAFPEAINLVRVGGRVLELGNISHLAVEVVPSMVPFKSLEMLGVSMYSPHYLKKSLDFLSEHMEHYPYREMCDATFALSQAAEAMDKSERREVTRAAILPQMSA